jgi:modification methylase
MKTTHKVIYNNSSNLDCIESNSIDIIVTSPPYPMIEMWDEIFSKMDPNVESALSNKDGRLAFELMHRQLDKVWDNAYRVLKEGGFACINIGDATRTIDKNFQIYLNRTRMSSYLLSLGFNALPEILWRKQTNAPNKFMGSGTLPAGAYVTLEHEYIMIFRKGRKREFKTSLEKLNRQKSSYFWEERNVWFSDIWDFKGTSQKMSNKKTRERSAAYPFELAYRLINMYSVQGDTVLDPFLGTGTTTIASIASKRNSIGVEVDSNFKEVIESNICYNTDFINKYIETRYKRHVDFVRDRSSMGKDFKHKNIHYDFPVVTSSEKEIEFNYLKNLSLLEDTSFIAEYTEFPKLITLDME